jgi:hypothetical protein
MSAGAALAFRPYTRNPFLWCPFLITGLTQVRPQLDKSLVYPDLRQLVVVSPTIGGGGAPRSDG